ncbi:MAG: hypothetical protein GY708_09440 [Actinomycetia bacterium]|nr:hypothetical protein [Actinomycetes bacterium]MCP4959827.1 hypothetical protein [Actinomycetes bacterium]
MGTAFTPSPATPLPHDSDELVATYRAAATIGHVTADVGVHRTTIAAHLERRGVPRHSEQAAWDDDILMEAAELKTAGLSLADLADRYRIDAQTVANRFRRTGVTVRPRRGWSSRAHSE